MSVSVTYGATCTVIETITTGTPAASDANARVTHNLFNSSASLSGSTTPPATTVAAFELALVAGAGSIDLRALSGTNGATIDGNGLKVQVLKIKAKATNENVISVAVGASNGYELAGADFKITLQPGQEFLFYGNDETPDIADADKVLDVAGTGTQGLDVIVVMG